MGSANEQRALLWTVDKFISFGADTAYVMVVPETTIENRAFNTNSGVAIGIFRGDADSTIVIGGHIDSAGREIPGANDNGSGTACVIELSRIWSQRSRHYNLLYAAFGGEERGLIGSKYFVNHYSEIDKVVLMLQIDMAGSEGWLIPFFDVKTHQAPIWLVDDAYTIDGALGYDSLNYPTHFFSLNNAFGGAGSDHLPFLQKNIPAIDFTAGINASPIHTPQDKIDYIGKPMLARSGRLVDGLLTKYQEQGIPTPRQGHYMLWQIFGGRLFIPKWLIITFDILAWVLGAWAFYHSRRNRLRIEKTQRVKFSGAKLFLMMIIIAIFTQLGEAAMQFLKGLRYPWLVPFNKYLWFAAIWMAAGIWVSSQLTRKWTFSPDPYVYVKRAAIFLFMFTILSGLGGERLALYPAMTLTCLSIAIFVRSPFLKILATLIAPVPMFRLMFMETLPFVARSSIEGGFSIDSFFRAFTYSAVLTAILVLWYLPTVYLFAYTFVSVQPALKVIKLYRKPAMGMLILVAIFGYGSYLFSFPAYNEKWRATVRVDSEYEIRSGESKLLLKGNEYFRNVKVKADTLHRNYDARIHKDELPLSFTADWIRVSGTNSVLTGEKDTVVVNWQLSSKRLWYRTSVEIQVDTLEIGDISTNLAFRHQKDKLKFSWFAEPPDTLQVTARFTIHPGAKLIREITAVFPEMPIPIEVTAELANVRYRTTVTYHDTLKLSQL